MLVDGIILAEGSSDKVIGLARDRIVTQLGTLVPFQGQARWITPNKIRLLNIVARVGEVPTGRDLTILIKKNGISITPAPITIAQNTNSVTLTAAQISGLTAVPGDYFTMDVVAVGSITPGSNLTVQIGYVETQ